MAFHKARALQEAEKSVAQGRIAQAIKQYLDILDNDPSEVSIYNTVGDLYIRERNITEGLRQFHKLAEAYVREGFNVKAIAIYRKISKLEPNSVDTLLKLGELYQLQGLSREAREQFLQAVEFFKRRNQDERALEVLRKLVQLDPDNINFHNRLAAECEQTGKRQEAALAYLEAAEIWLRRGDQVAAEPALNKAAELDPKNSRIQILRARVAIARQEPEEAERIINATPELQADPAVKRILLDSYLGTRKLQEAEKLVREVFQANPSDFAPIADVSALLVEKGGIDEAYQLLESVAEPVVSHNNAAPLLEALRRIINRAPTHIPTLELIHRICERTADELDLPEVLEALGRAHEEAGDLEKAEEAYLKLIGREPENENYRALLNAVQRELGKEIKSPDFSTHEMALAAQEGISSEPAAMDAQQEQMVSEALENSDLFARYNLTEKAMAELEKVLQVYPDQIEVHQRILEISCKGFPERGAMAAAQLARIFSEHGDVEMASKYHAIALARGALQEISLPQPSPGEKREEHVTPPPSPPETPRAGTPTEFPISVTAPQEPVAAPTAPASAEVPFDLTPAETPKEAPAAPLPAITRAGQTLEFDLSEDLEAMTALGREPPAPSAPEPEPVAPPREEAPTPAEIAAFPQEPAPPPVVEEGAPATETPTEVPELPLPPEFGEDAISVDLEDSRIEVEFYLENGFIDEARQTVTALEEKYPGSPFVAELRRRLDTRAGKQPAQPPELELVSPAEEAGAAERPAELEIADEVSLAESPLEVGQPEPEVASPPVPPPLADLAGDLASSADRLATPRDAHRATSPVSPEVAAAPTAGPAQGADQLSGLLAEMEESDTSPTEDDPETHYNLGVAFREMALLDESIGEFQKVVKGAWKGNYPPNFLPACSLLAICFMEKKMPAIAVKWYLRALETPGLDEEALLALQYDLGMAYEQAGDPRRALERFTEVYSQNIDFRDVAEKIRQLQQKV